MLFNCDNQPDFAVLQIPTIIAEVTAGLFYKVILFPMNFGVKT
jgi:hypothetical protein